MFAMTKHVLRRRARLLACTALCVCTAAQAGLTIRGTRFFYYELSDEAVVSFRSLNDYPVLVQAWIDDGDAEADPGSVAVPFVLSPAVARVEPHEGQSIRILGTGGDFPPDRETLFWFNLLEVPPVPEDRGTADGNYLQIAGRARMKFFYRPRDLSLPPERAHERLHFSLASAPDDGRAQILVKNDSPYHVTFNHLDVRRVDQGEAEPPLAQLTADGRQARMVAPFGDLLMPLQGKTARLPTDGSVEVVFGVINDLGGTTSGSGTLHAP